MTCGAACMWAAPIIRSAATVAKGHIGVFASDFALLIVIGLFIAVIFIFQASRPEVLVFVVSLFCRMAGLPFPSGGRHNGFYLLPKDSLPRVTRFVKISDREGERPRPDLCREAERSYLGGAFVAEMEATAAWARSVSFFFHSTACSGLPKAS